VSAPTLSEFATLDEMFVAAAETLLRAGREALETRGIFHLVLAGGSTPRGLYELLRDRDDFDWSRTHFWWGDERCVPPDHKDSNYKMAWESWLESLAPVRDRVHRMRGELDSVAGAEDYIAQLRAVFGDAIPVFDIVLLGLGEDGHTASLFPGRPEAVEDELLVTAARAPVAPEERISLGLKVLTAAHRRLFLVAGANKRAAMDQLSGESIENPAARIARQPQTEIYFSPAT